MTRTRNGQFGAGNKEGRKSKPRPKSVNAKRLRQMAEGYNEEMLEILVSIARGEVGEWVTQGKGDDAETVFQVKASDQRAAANDVLEWGNGKRGNHIGLTDMGLPENVADYEPEHWRKVRDLADEKLAQVAEGVH